MYCCHILWDLRDFNNIRENHPDLPVYALTANATAGEEFYILKGFNGYLAKPVDSMLLEKTIMKHLSMESKKGFECEVSFAKKGNKVILYTENMGIAIQNTTTVNERRKTIYAAITRDHCAVTDIWASCAE
ncbi:MAG: hypothetical protein K6E85_14125 [Lachnospiraceae bacterium]|nr:hypothetical protein [Lachnospiraceae bacterium]